MGNYSTLTIGDIQFAWKYYIPTFLPFLFQDDDFYKKEHAEPTEWDRYAEIGFRTTCARSRRALDDLGYSLAFVTEVYDHFYDHVHQRYLDRLETKLAESLALDSESDPRLEREMEEHLAQNPPRSRLQDVQDFVDFLRLAIDTKFRDPKLRQPVTLRLGESTIVVPGDEFLASRHGHALADFEQIQSYFRYQVDQFRAGLVQVASMFDEDGLTDYFEVVTLSYIRLILEATSGRRWIKLDVADLEFDSENDIRNLRSALADELAQKVTLYNRVFRALTEAQTSVRERFAISKVDGLLKELPSLHSATQKGARLEDAAATLFNAPDGLTVVQRRYSTRDQEIDLLVQNDIGRPFWMALNSPLFFVECKNWSSPVGSPEIRDFEVKMQNHFPLVRVGFLIAPSGFTAAARTEIVRGSRADYTTILIGREDLEELAHAHDGILAWLERRIHQLN